MGKRRAYPAEFRKRMIELVRAGRSPGQLSKEFKVTAQSIRNWMKEAERGEDVQTGGLSSSEQEELRRLRREVEQLRLEREILAKATAWFARETHTVPPRSTDS